MVDDSKFDDVEDAELELDAEDEDGREVVEDEGVAVDDGLWVEERRDAGVVEPKNVHTSSGPRGICETKSKFFLSFHRGYE